MKETIISELRNRKSGIAEFRSAAGKMFHLLAQESFPFIKQRRVIISTPIAPTTGSVADQNIVLIPILRSGLAMLGTFLHYYENAGVGFIGLKRDEKTFEPHEYYKNIPKIGKNDKVILLDPMIATGGSAVAALRILKKIGVRENQILCVFLISAPQGLKNLRKNYPGVDVIVGIRDKDLNRHKYIIPGLGDFGDRYFGTE